MSLTAKLENFVKSKVKTGDYNNASEVVREALRLLQKEDAVVLERKTVRLRKALQAGIDSPDAADFDMKKVIKRLKRTKA
ncbi:MAG TPA: type II toxin-antitoxin system ParD family antitoxin [Reyranella sp.]